MASHTEQDRRSPEAAKGGMRVETWIFLGLTGFFAIAAVLYGLLAPTEPVGIVALSLTAGLTLIIGTFLRFVSRRLEEPRPEDNDDAEVSDGAGDIGFFSPGFVLPVLPRRLRRAGRRRDRLPAGLADGDRGRVPAVRGLRVHLRVPPPARASLSRFRTAATGDVRATDGIR